jgi:CBS domain-containing protein
MSIERICSRVTVSVDERECATAAAQRMVEHQTGTLVVLNDRRQPIGMLTDRDLVTRVMATGKDPEKVPVGDVMTRRPTTVSKDTPIETAISMMQAGGFRRMPVVGERKQLIGIVSLDDVLSLLAEEFTSIGKLVDEAMCKNV